MKLRWKLLALLWLLTLLPLAVVSWLDYRRLGALAQTISQRDHAAAIRTANEHLHNMAASQATRLANGQAMVELLVRHFGAAAEMALRGPVPAAPPAVSFAEEFTDSTRRPGDIVVSERYFTLAADGTREPLPVSFESAAFRTVPGDAAVTVYDDIARLAPLQALARELYRDYGNWLHWLTVVLDNGLHLAYPGHGGYPEGFDPRSRAWYRAQIREPGLQWSRPYIDASTRQVMWTVSVPLLDAGASGWAPPASTYLSPMRSVPAGCPPAGVSTPACSWYVPTTRGSGWLSRRSTATPRAAPAGTPCWPLTSCRPTTPVPGRRCSACSPPARVAWPSSPSAVNRHCGRSVNWSATSWSWC